MTDIRIATNLSRIEQTASSLASQRARELRAEGRDVIALSVGEPDFPTPPHIIEAAFDAAKRGETRYTNAAGTPELKAAVRGKFKRDNGLEFADNEVMVANGGKQIIYCTMAATVDRETDEVIVPAPYWLAYVDVIKLSGGTPVPVSCPIEKGFKVSPEALDAAITPNTRWLILNSPGNPSGAVYTAEELLALAEVLRRHPHVAVLSDDIYEHILFDGARFATLAQVAPDLRDRTVTLNGCAKAYAMTGWRVGFCGGPAPLIKQMVKLAQQSTGCVAAPCQAAAVAALNGPQDFIEVHKAQFQSRRDLVVSMLNQTAGVTCTVPAGAFYAFPSCAGLIGKKTPAGKVIENDLDLVMYFLEDADVAVVHGAAYGLSPYFRVSFAASEEELTTACERIQRAAAALR